MTKRLTIALVAVALFVLMAVMPVSAVGLHANGTIINQGATIFIGEQDLNVTHAMDQAYCYGIPGNTFTGPPSYPVCTGGGTGQAGTAIENNSNLHFTAIGWWASAAVLYTTSPSKTIDLGVNRRFASLTVAPSDFVGYTGNWYLLDPTGSRPLTFDGAAPIAQNAAMVFSVADPSLDMKIWDFNQNTDVTGGSVPQGEKLGFRIDTNMYPAVDSRYRSNVIDDSITGYWPAGSPSWAANNWLVDPTTTWGNVSVGGDLITIPDPAMPCCRVITLYNMPFTNYTSTGAWYTWSNGHYGCNYMTSPTVYYNTSFNLLMYWNSMGIGTTGYHPGYSTNGGADGLSWVSPMWAPSDYTSSGGCGQWMTVDPVDGYIDLVLKDEANSQIDALYNQSVNDVADVPGPFTVLNNFVDNQPWFWGTKTATPTPIDSATGVQHNGYVWDTAALDGSNQYAYPVGTYTVYAKSTLNKMKDNYKQGGADYTGKTVSQSYTITLVSDTVKIEANKDSVVRSKSFSVTVTGRPSTEYYLWVKGTSSMQGTYDDQPPMIVLNQDGVFMDPNPWLNPAIFIPASQVTTQPSTYGMYQYENGAGATISDDVSVNPYTKNGTLEYAKIVTSTSGTRTIEFTTTNWTKAQKYTIRVENEFPAGSKSYKNDEVDVSVEKGAVTIVAAGDQSYYLGEEIKFSGTNTETYETYLFIVGPNLKEVGSQIQNSDPRHYAVVNNDPSTFKQVDVNGDNTWSWKWGTSNYALDAGTYTIYAVSQPYDKDNLADAAYGTVSIIIKKPFVSATASQSTVAKGDRIYITGTAEGQPSNVQIWVLGKNYYAVATESVNSDASFKYEIRQETTRALASGQYFVVVQHPMQNNRFDITTVTDSAYNTWVENLMLIDTSTHVPTRVFKLGGAGSLQGSDAAEALVQAINDANVDDTYTKLQFLVEEPVIRIDPIGDKHVGDKFTITAQTNLAVDDEVLVQVYSSSFKPTDKSQSGEFSGATGTVKVTKGDSGMNKISFDIDSSTFKPDEYIVTAQAVIQDNAVGTALFNVLETPVVTATPVVVATTAAPTAVPTTVVTTVPTPVPTTKSPGYGALIALIGLGAVAFIVVRRH
jgi:PGF-CTERM protein